MLRTGILWCISEIRIKANTLKDLCFTIIRVVDFFLFVLDISLATSYSIGCICLIEPKQSYWMVSWFEMISFGDVMDTKEKSS
jgi:hypothetical protein